MPALDAAAIETWVFDLDNTLYPASCNLFAQVDHLIGAYIAERFDLDRAEARRRQKAWFHKYGTTLRGLMIEHGVDPVEYMTYVHAIDLSPIRADPVMEAALGRLPGRKLVFTNASVAHAERVMDRLGIGHHFEAIYDVVAADYIPKPDPRPYTKFAALHGVEPTRACMVEDIARNLVPAAALGMTTVWVRGEGRHPARDAVTQASIHHTVDDLGPWLAGLV